MPLFMFAGSIGLIGLYYLWTPWALKTFSVLWDITFVSYLFQTLFSFAIDPAEARRSWFEGIAFPGLLSIGVMAIALLMPFIGLADRVEPGRWSWVDITAQVILGWSAISTMAAWGVYRIDKAGRTKVAAQHAAGARRIRAAVVRDRLRRHRGGAREGRSQMGQDDQIGKSQDPGEMTARRAFDTLQSQDMRNERRIFWSEVAIIVIVALLVTAYLVALYWLRPGTALMPHL